MAIYSNKNIKKNHEIKLSQISPPSPKSWKYLYVKYMVYTVFVLLYVFI